jgi:two-component system, OmpR family, sensor histidine kinase KdpD
MATAYPRGHLHSRENVIADAALLTRILASLLADAAHRCPAGPAPALTASCPAGVVEVRITDQGPDERGGPHSLALRLAGDLAEAMGITLRCERTPSGGRTVILVLPAAASRPPGAPAREKYRDEEMQLT